MFRKHFRFRRLALGLAFAAVALPVAPAGAISLSTFVDGGPAPVSFATVSSPASYLRYHEIGFPVAAGPQIRSEQARAAGLRADGLRWQAMARFYQSQQPTKVVVASTSTSNGFDWRDAGIGASTVFGTALVLGIALLLTRRHQHTGLTSA